MFCNRRANRSLVGLRMAPYSVVTATREKERSKRSFSSTVPLAADFLTFQNGTLTVFVYLDIFTFRIVNACDGYWILLLLATLVEKVIRSFVYSLIYCTLLISISSLQYS